MTLFNDGLGRTLSRDPKILEALLVQYRNSNLMLLAQAGIEIEYLQLQVEKLQMEIAGNKTAKAPVPSKLIKPPIQKD